MNGETAKTLLNQVMEFKKKANTGILPVDLLLNGATRAGKSIANYAKDTGLAATGDKSTITNPAYAEAYDNATKDQARKHVGRLLGLGLGAGAAIRGFHGLMGTLNEPKPYTSPRFVDMPIVRDSKKKEKQAADSVYGVDGVIPSILLGGPLAIYGGWRAVDAYLDRQKKRQAETDYDTARQQYEQALLGSYKKAVDENLQEAFKLTEKQALLNELKNTYLAYALGSFPLAYYAMDKHMKNNGQQALLERAVKERAIQRAKSQPPELYAHLVDAPDQDKPKDARINA